MIDPAFLHQTTNSGPDDPTVAQTAHVSPAKATARNNPARTKLVQPGYHARWSITLTLNCRIVDASVRPLFGLTIQEFARRSSLKRVRIRLGEGGLMWMTAKMVQPPSNRNRTRQSGLV